MSRGIRSPITREHSGEDEVKITRQTQQTHGSPLAEITVMLTAQPKVPERRSVNKRLQDSVHETSAPQVIQTSQPQGERPLLPPIHQELLRPYNQLLRVRRQPPLLVRSNTNTNTNNSSIFINTSTNKVFGDDSLVEVGIVDLIHAGGAVKLGSFDVDG